MKTAFWEVSKICNMNCPMCSNESGVPIATELSVKEIIELCSQLISIGLEDFRFYGGEPFLRRDLTDVVRFLSNRNILLAFYTNGSVLNDDVLSLLEICNKPRLFISLDSATPDLHDEIRGSKGLFQVVLHNISEFVSKGFRVDIIVTISRKNFLEIENIYKLANDLGVSGVKPNIVSKIGRARECWGELSLSPQQLLEAAKSIFDANAFYFNEKGIRKPCVAGVDEIYISANGDVFPCALLLDRQYCAGNIRDNSIVDLLNSPSGIFMDIVTTLKKQNFCIGCNRKPNCRGGCRARALVEHNDIYGKDTFSCLYHTICSNR